MKEDQIIRKRKIIEKEIAKREGIYSRVQDRMEKSLHNIKMAQKKLWRLTEKCKHRFDKENCPDMMGKGKCEICGKSDY